MEPVDPQVRFVAFRDPQIGHAIEQPSCRGDDLGPSELVPDAEMLAKTESEVIGHPIDSPAGARWEGGLLNRSENTYRTGVAP